MSTDAESALNLLTLLREGEVYLGAANVTAFHDPETGEIEVNDQGLVRYLYATSRDYVLHQIDGLFAPHKVSYYIGDRSDGEVVYNETYSTLTAPVEIDEDEDEDGSSVYSAFLPATPE